MGFAPHVLTTIALDLDTATDLSDPRPERRQSGSSADLADASGRTLPAGVHESPIESGQLPRSLLRAGARR